MPRPGLLEKSGTSERRANIFRHSTLVDEPNDQRPSSYMKDSCVQYPVKIAIGLLMTRPIFDAKVTLSTESVTTVPAADPSCNLDFARGCDILTPARNSRRY